MNQETMPQCECEAVADLASNSHCPIEFDEALNEYNILSRDGKTYYRLYYCFVCGGSLPKSNRTDLYTQPNQRETEQVKNVLGKARTIEEALAELGEPDEVTAAPKAEKDRSGKRYRQFYHFTSRWKSLDLTVRERSDHSIDLAIVGKYRGAQNGSTKRKKA
jgi:hypothetical protein